MIRLGRLMKRIKKRWKVLISLIVIFVGLILFLISKNVYQSIVFCNSQNEAVEIFKRNEHSFVNVVNILNDKNISQMLTALNYEKHIPKDYKSDFETVFKNKVSSIEKSSSKVLSIEESCPNTVVFVFSSFNNVEYGVVFVGYGDVKNDIPNYFKKIKDSWYAYTIAYT